MTALPKFSRALTLLALLASSSQVRATPNDEPPAWQSLAPAASGESEEPDEESDEESDEGESSDESEPPINPFSSVPPDSVERSLSRALSAPDASFCKAQRAALRDDPLLCSLSKLAVRQRCPGLREACSVKPAEARPPRSSASSTLKNGLAAIGDLAFWSVLAALLIAVAFALRRVLVGARFSPREAAERPPPSSTEVAPVAHPAAETDAARLWALAERFAASARFEDAVAALQGALIHALRITGKLHVTPALTNGDYLRALRSDENYGAARDVFRSVEAVQFGGAPANAELYRKVSERVRPIVARVLGLLLLCAFCCGQSGCANSLSFGLEGDGRGLGVLTQLLREQQVTVRRRIRPLNELEPDVHAILVVGEQSSEAWSKLLQFASDGGTLVVTGSSEDLAKATNVHYTAEPYEGRLELPAGFEPTQLELSAVAQHALDLRTSVQDERTFATASKRPYVAERNYGEGRVLFFGDDEFLSDASLSVGDNAFFAVSLLSGNGQTLELVGPWTGGGASSTFSSLYKAGLGALVAQLALLAVLFGWHGGTAFGLRRDPSAVRRRAFREHVLALGENYRRARATRFALATYGSWLIERLRERLSPQQPIGLIELASRMALRVGRPETELVLLLTEARDAQEDSASARPSANDLTTLEKLESMTLRAGGSK